MEEGVEYLLEATIRMECDIDVRIRALILYQHFMRCVGEVQYDPGLVAASALNLSSKVSEEIIDLDTLVLLFYCIVNKTEEPLDVESDSLTMLKKSFITVDFIMQRMLEFTLNHRLAHQYLLPFLDLIFSRSEKIASYHQAVSRACLSLLSDFYTSRKCINYKPEHIAIACIDATLHMYELNDDVEISDTWYEGLCKDFNSEKLKEIKHDVFVLYINENKLAVSSAHLPSDNDASNLKKDLVNSKGNSSNTKEDSSKHLGESSKQNENVSITMDLSKAKDSKKSKLQLPEPLDDFPLCTKEVPSNTNDCLATEGDSSISTEGVLTSENSARNTKETKNEKVIEEITID